ncbi:MAG: calcium/sodium antiporter [Candidatus Syntropharchaeia archaeon]
MLEYILFVPGFVLLVKGADFLIEGSSSLAKRFGVSQLIIGLTIVAFGTSLPEFAVNVLSAIKGETEIALGNVVGSNIANILLVLGLSTMVFPFPIQKSTVRKEIPFNIFSAFVLFLMAINTITRAEGMIMLLFFVIFMLYTFKTMKSDTERVRIKEEIKPQITVLMIIGGLMGIFLGGKWVVEGAVAIARALGVSEFMISITMVAFGTSLPELITSLIAAIKKNSDLAVGNVIGSNVFNVFYVLGISALITPIASPSFAETDLLFLIFVSILLFIFMFIGEKNKLERWQGGTMVLLYVLYISYIVIRG